jgi:hypothetical protein
VNGLANIHENPVGSPLISFRTPLGSLRIGQLPGEAQTHDQLRLALGALRANNHQDLDSNFYFGPSSGLYERVASGQVFKTPQSPVGKFWASVWGTLVARVGFAYDVFGDGKTSVLASATSQLRQRHLQRKL